MLDFARETGASNAHTQLGANMDEDDIKAIFAVIVLVACIVGVVATVYFQIKECGWLSIFIHCVINAN